MSESPKHDNILEEYSNPPKIHCLSVFPRFLALDEAGCDLRYIEQKLNEIVDKEVEGLKLIQHISTSFPSEGIPEESKRSFHHAYRCDVSSANDGRFSLVVLAQNQSELFEDHEETEHLLQSLLRNRSTTLCLSAVPPNGKSFMPAAVRPMRMRRSQAVANGRPVVQLFGTGPSWIVQMLRQLAALPTWRHMADIGLVGIDGFAVAASPPQATPPPLEDESPPPPAWWRPVPLRPTKRTAEEIGIGASHWPPCMRPMRARRGTDRLGRAGDARVARKDERGDGVGSEDESDPGSGGVEGAGGGEEDESVPGVEKTKREDGPRHGCDRKAIGECSEEEFRLDLFRFVQWKHLTKLVPPGGLKNFPPAYFNGNRLDLFNLYKEVVSRGGYNVRNGINWKGQIFPAMKNYTSGNKATAVSAVLKKHYEMYLLEYERCHDDVVGEHCVICKGGTEGDWVNCGICKRWAHFGCDTREGLGSFKEYARVGGREYVCLTCKSHRKDGYKMRRK